MDPGLGFGSVSQRTLKGSHLCALRVAEARANLQTQIMKEKTRWEKCT